MPPTLKRRWLRWTLLACVLIGGTVAAVRWEACLQALIYNVPVNYSEPFGPAIARADRIVVRAGGFDCCGPVDETNLLFVVTDPTEIAAVANHIRFEPRTTRDSFAETCLCCGCPGMDWYVGKKRIALTAMQHGHSLRWRGFSTVRILGFRAGYGDGPLTEDSQAWLKEWFLSHGIGQAADPGATDLPEGASK